MNFKNFLITFFILPVLLVISCARQESKEAAAPTPPPAPQPEMRPRDRGFRPPGGPQGMEPGFFSSERRGMMIKLLEKPPGELRAQIDQWPRFKSMTPEERDKFIQRLEEFREARQLEAMHQARRLGIQVAPEQKDKFASDFWSARREMEETLRKEMEPRRKQLESDLLNKLQSQYGKSDPVPMSDRDGKWDKGGSWFKGMKGERPGPPFRQGGMPSPPPPMDAPPKPGQEAPPQS